MPRRTAGAASPPRGGTVGDLPASLRGLLLALTMPAARRRYLVGPSRSPHRAIADTERRSFRAYAISERRPSPILYTPQSSEPAQACCNSLGFPSLTRHPTAPPGKPGRKASELGIPRPAWASRLRPSRCNHLPILKARAEAGYHIRGWASTKGWVHRPMWVSYRFLTAQMQAPNSENS
jgi:hypothetical protein